MSNKRTKKHHFVPKVLQKSFMTENAQIWYSEKDCTGVFSNPEIRNTGSAFRGRNYYTVLQGDKPSDIVEKKFYGTIDDYLGRILPDVFESFDRNVIPTFSGEPLYCLHEVIFLLFKRTPDFVRSYDEEQIGREIVEKTLIKLRGLTGVTDQIAKQRGMLSKASELKKVGRDVRVRSQISRSDKVLSAMSDMEVRWARSSGKHSFILSSSIAYRIGNGGTNGVANPDMEIWMPISPKIAMVLLRDSENKIPLVNQVDRDKVREFNKFALQNCNQIASHSEQLLASLISDY